MQPETLRRRVGDQPVRLEFFADEKVVLVYGTDAARVALLHQRIVGLASGRKERVAVHELPGFEPVSGCRLFLSVGKQDRGVWLAQRPNTLEWAITAGWWENVAGLLEPFCSEPTKEMGRNNLDYGFTSEITPIISLDRGW